MKDRIRMSDAEWEVMNVVWKLAPVPASAVEAELKSAKQWTLTTVRTLLRRLVQKGAVASRPEGRRFLYTPRVTLEDCVHRESESFWERVLGRAPSTALVHLVGRADLNRADIRELRRILKEKEK
jgi:BlaI family penicillinase repressor